LAAFQTSARVLWRAAPGRTLAVDPPAHLDRDPDGVPHRIDGPSVVWADGTPWFHLHGVRVPRRPDLGEWSVEEIHAVPNTEVRRVMIEAIGWDRYLRQARLERVADVPDPGNPPHRLELYELPDDVYGPFRLLLMTNGSPDRSGGLRRYAEFVPRGMDDPVEAVAWQYGVPAETYRRLQRRT
jgi:hypothetical protein